MSSMAGGGSGIPGLSARGLDCAGSDCGGLDCCELESHILYSATMLSTESFEELSRPGPTLDLASLELDLAQLSSPPGEAGYGTNYRVLGAELERELDQCLDERASLLAAFDGRDAGGASSEIPQVIDQASVLQQYVIESILSADEALRYDPATESFYRITLNSELDSDSTDTAIGNHLHQVPSVYESMLVGFLTAAIMSQRVAEVKTEADEVI